MTQTIHVDGDACPVREEVFRVAFRLGVKVIVVGNGARPVRLPEHPDLRLVIVPEGADAADDWIVEHITRGDVCVTADIPLAARCLEKGARALSPRGHSWNADNIGGALAGRAVNQARREAGAVTGGPAPLSQADRSRFLSALDTAVQQARRDLAAPPKRAWIPFE
jgi:uncharacterized protein YaiI (UPF0178 family)